MLTVFLWYIAMQVIAFAAWPLAFAVCHRLPDRGYGLAKGLGLLLVTYITWALAHLGGRWPALGFSFQTVSAAWAIVVVISLVSISRRLGDLWTFLRRRWRYVLMLELVFVLAFATMVALRATVPHISYFVAEPTMYSINDSAAEKFMDFAILNGLLASSAFPPHDAWVSGQSLNYYYFGHMLWAVLIKFCSVRPEIGFNLALAAAFAMASALAFSLGYNLTARRRWAFLMLFLVVLCSNLDGFWQFLGAVKNAVWPDTSLIQLTGDRPWWRVYDFWRSSRAIENTINEFPAFSFILGDLHAHMSALVLNLCGWNLAVQIFRAARHYRSLWRYEVNGFDELFLVALIIGALSATNSWDVPLFAGVVALALWAGNTGQRDPYEYIPGWLHSVTRTANAAEACIVSAIVAIFGVGFLFYPFLSNFQPPQPPEGALIKLVNAANRSSPFEFATHWGLLTIFPLAALCMIVRWGVASRWRRRPAVERTTAAHESIRLVALVLVVLSAGFVFVPLWQGWVAVLTGAGTVLIGGLLMVRHLPPMSRWLCGLLLLFCLVTWFCELFYVDDVFDGPIERINTVFKSYYGLWPMMAVATVMALRLLLNSGTISRRTFSQRTRAWVMVTPLVVCGAPYMVMGTVNRITSTTRLGHWSPPEDSPTTPAPAKMLRPEARAKNLAQALDGLRWMSFTNPDDYAAIMWIRAELPNDAVILEAASTQYTYSGRISTMTGRPAFAGWLNHAWGWRGAAFADEVTRRLNRASAIYMEQDPTKAAAMLQEEDIQYVVVGDQERKQYPGMDEAKFSGGAGISDLVYRHGGTSVYKVK